MPDDAGDFTGTLAAAKSIVAAVAPSYGLTATQINEFQNQLDLHYKAGNDIWCTSSTSCQYTYAISGIAVIPTCSGPYRSSTQYVWGLYIYNGSNQTNTSNTFFANDAEPLREPIEAALAGWRSCS
jgi:hypothetical protein